MNAMLRMHHHKRSMVLACFSLSVILFALVLSPMPVLARPLLPPVAPPRSWPMYGFDAQHTNNNSFEWTISTTNVSTLQPAWQAMLPHDPSAPVAVQNGLVYQATEFGFYAIDAKTGITRWSLMDNTSTNEDASPIVAGGLVYVESDKGSSDVGSYPVRAYNALTGALVWTRSGVGGPGSMTYNNGVIYIGGLGGTIALNATTGQTIWTALEADGGSGYSSYSERSPAVANGIVYTTNYSDTTGSGYLLAYNAATGQKLWQYATPPGNGMIPQIITGGASVADGQVYFSTNEDTTYAINATTGKFVWSSRTGAYFPRTAPALANGIVYSYTGLGIYAFDAKTGQQLWMQPIGNATYPVGPRISIANGVVYAGEFSNTSYDNSGVRAFDAQTGKQLWSYDLQAFETYSPVIINGMLYIGASGGTGVLYAFKLP